MFVVLFVLAGFLMQACISEMDPSYYIVEMPDAADEEFISKAPTKREFKVYWNVPTMQCRSKKIPFSDLSRFGIIQNTRDDFRQGDRITILYDPGYFPAMFNSSPGVYRCTHCPLTYTPYNTIISHRTSIDVTILYDPGYFPAMFDSSPGVYRYRNGGVPQEGNVEKHLEAFNASVEEGIPNKDYDGIAVIDFESWKPIFLQNYGTLKPYIDVSYDIERKEHWWWPQSWIKTTAQERYEKAAKVFMDSTIKLAKKMRPKATWGYYAYPYCYNKAVDYCSAKTMKENDRLGWLWQESTGIFPSVYTSRGVSGGALRQTARGAVHEALRVNTHGAVLPYLSYVYRDQRHAYYTRDDLEVLLDAIYNTKADGVIVWGASSDVNTKEKCEKLLDYITNVFGPTIAQFTKGDRPRITETTTAASTLAALMNEGTTASENTPPMDKPTTETQTEASSEQSYQSTTQLMDNVADFINTANKVKEYSIQGEVVVNSVIQFFDRVNSNNTFNETTEQPEYTFNPDDTPGFTQLEQELRLETTNTSDSEANLNFKRKDPDYSVLSSFPPFSTETENMTDNIELDFYTREPITTAEINYRMTTDLTVPQERPDRSNIILDNDKESNEILESLAQLSGSLDPRSSATTPSISKFDDEELANASKILQDLAGDGDQESYEHTFKTTVDNNQSNDVKTFYDYGSMEESIDSPQESKPSNKYEQEAFEDDTILQAVAEILNSTERMETIV